jgi:hypothetical protein
MSPEITLHLAAFSFGVTLTLRVTFRPVTLSVTLAHDTILLKKKRASYANARLSSFDGTDKPRAPLVALNRRAPLRLRLLATDSPGGAR